jgi:rhodanese-related sulfurtransferase
MLATRIMPRALKEVSGKPVSNEPDSSISILGDHGLLRDDCLVEELTQPKVETVPEVIPEDLPAGSEWPMLRSLGSFEEFFWLIDQNRPIHFVLAARVQGATTAAQWRYALDLVQQRHPLLSVCIETNGSSRPHFRQELAVHFSLTVVCESGYRSSIAASLLKSQRFERLSNVIGGMQAVRQILAYPVRLSILGAGTNLCRRNASITMRLRPNVNQQDSVPDRHARPEMRRTKASSSGVSVRIVEADRSEHESLKGANFPTSYDLRRALMSTPQNQILWFGKRYA